MYYLNVLERLHAMKSSCRISTVCSLYPVSISSTADNADGGSFPMLDTNFIVMRLTDQEEFLECILTTVSH
jgi:hypothetical protein